MLRGVGLSIVIFMSSSLWAQAVSPASKYVSDIFKRGEAIMSKPKEADRLRGICQLMNANVAKTAIGLAWLGQFANLNREKQAVARFHNLVPSILISRLAQGAGGGNQQGGSYTVSPTATDRGNNQVGVPVTITTDRGSSFNLTVVLLTNGSRFKFFDAEYMGFSAVSYLGQDYQEQLQETFNRDPQRSMPVTELIKSITSESGFIRCP